MKNLFLFSLLFLCAVSTIAQDQQKFEFDYKISSTAFGDERDITVYLPPSYYENPDEKFTVTYMLDGHFDPFINLGVTTLEYNTYMHKYTPTIVVGIHAKERGWEFSAPTPGDEDDEDYEGGRAPELQQHFKNEVFPFVESINLKILPFRTIIGHSSGGKFVLYSLFSNEKDLFDAYIAISPALRPGEDNILESAEERLKNGETFNKFLYCSSGSVGEREELFGAAIAKLDALLTGFPKHGLIWKKDNFLGMGHWTCVPPSLNSGMVELTRAFRVDEQMFYEFAENKSQTMTEQIEAFYKKRKEQYSFIDIPSAGYIYQTAITLADKGKHQSALDIYTWGIKQHNINLTLNKAKGRLQMKMGDNAGAKQTFQRCLEVAELIKDKLGEERYASQKEYIHKKLSELGE